jgi:arginase
LLEREKIAVHFARGVAQKGFRDLFQLALTRARSAGGGYGLAIDMDAFDPIDAPGVGSPEENGLRALEVLNTLHGLAHDPLLKAVEIVEYNPHRDENGKTAKLLEDIIFSLCGVREKEA